MLDLPAFAALIKRKRGEKRLTQETLALDVFGDPTRKGDISRIENAKQTPQEATIQRLCAALNISNAELDPIRTARPHAAQLDHIPTLSREELQNLAARFEVENPFDQTGAALRDFLTKKAEEYRSYKSVIDAIDERTKGLHNLKAAAQEAAERLDFAEVEALLSRVQEVEKEIAAETGELRARNALLRGRVEEAYHLLYDAADSFAIIDPVEPARRRSHYGRYFFEHGFRYGGIAHRKLEDLLTGAAIIAEPLNKEIWARIQNNLGIALQEQGLRTSGAAGTDLLAKAVAAHGKALTITTQAEHPVQWAETQECLALAEQAIADHAATGDPAPHLRAALKHVESALTVYDPEHLSYRHDNATTLREEILARLAQT